MYHISRISSLDWICNVRNVLNLSRKMGLSDKNIHKYLQLEIC